ncbi:hypothetical protein [Ferruginibacter sp.]
MNSVNFQELLDKLPPADRQIMIDHFVNYILGKNDGQTDIVFRRTAKISTLATEEEMVKEIAAAFGQSEDDIRSQNVPQKLREITTKYKSAEALTTDFKNFLTQNNARKDKFEELFDLGNFLVATNLNYKIQIPDKIESVPDFILLDEDKKIGVEHTRIMDKESKSLIQETKSILKRAEHILLARDNQRKQLINISISYWLMNTANKSVVNNRFSIAEKNQLAITIADYIESILLNKEIVKPSFIDNVSVSDRSLHPLCIEINENYVGKTEYESLILPVLSAKEEKYASYSEDKTLTELWLLVVLNGVSAPSSYILSSDILNNPFSSQFDKIFFFDGFSHESFLFYSKEKTAT